MDPILKFNIPFIGLSFGKHNFEYPIDSKFFDAFDSQIIGSELGHFNGNAVVTLDKKNTFFELHINTKGIALLSCDISNEPFEQELSNTLNLVVKFGEKYNDDDVDILIIPQESFQINVAQFIYEAIVLSIPIKKTHPGIENGTLKSEIVEKLKEIEIQEHEDIDPRWEKLNQLLTPKKQ